MNEDRWRKLRVGCRAAVVVLVLGGLRGAARARALPASAERFTAVSFRMEPRDPQAQPYEIRLQASGEGIYKSGTAEMPVESPMRVSAATLARIALGMPRVQSGKCEGSEKNVAQTGRKTVGFESESGPVRCTFNFSDDSKLTAAVEAFQAMAETMNMGVRLAHDHRFDRLGLDKDMDLFESEVADGRALEPGNISPVLESVAQDDRVIDRVRRKAQRLVAQSADAAAAGSSPR